MVDVFCYSGRCLTFVFLSCRSSRSQFVLLCVCVSHGVFTKKAYEARGMERRKSKQFDGTDAIAGSPTQGGGVTGSGSGGEARGLLRREVSQAYTVVAGAGAAIASASVDALALLLRLLEEQV